MLKANGCMTCHAKDEKVVGPSFQAIAAKYAGQADAVDSLTQSVRNGSRGLLFLEPLVEVETRDGRIAYGPVTVEDVASLPIATVGAHKLRPTTRSTPAKEPRT